jgi:hypothetical protein
MLEASYITKAVAASVCALALVLLWRRRRAGAPKFALVSAATFFSGGLCAACIGAVLEGAFNDLRSGVAWISMLVATQAAAGGAWCLGGALLAATPLASSDADGDESLLRVRVSTFPLLNSNHSAASEPLRLGVVWAAAVSAILFFCAAIVAIFLHGGNRFDLCMMIASYGGVGLAGGALALYCRHADSRMRRAAVLCLVGVLVTLVGFLVSSLWLGNLCDHASASPLSACPIPSWITSDSVYHVTLIIAYSCILAGVQDFLLALEWARISSSASSAQH